MTDGSDRFDLLSYPVRLSSGKVAEGAVDVDVAAAERARERGQKLSVVVVLGLVVGGAAAVQLWGFAVTLGIGYVAFTLMALTGPGNEAVEHERRAVPAGVGERIVAAHRQELERRRRWRLVGVAVLVAVTLGVAYAAGMPRGLVTVGGFAVLLAYGALTETRSDVRLFAPELVREGVPRRIAEEEAATVVEEPFAAGGGETAGPDPDDGADGATETV